MSHTFPDAAETAGLGTSLGEPLHQGKQGGFPVEQKQAV